MGLLIKNIRPATIREWDDIWKDCHYSTYFHSHEWAAIWNAYTERKISPDPQLVLFSDGKKALLPFSREMILKGMVKRYISSPGGTFGGWISLDTLDHDHGVLLVKYLLKLPGLVWRINPYDHLIPKLDLKVQKPEETHSINLAPGFDSIYKGWTKGHSSAATKARKAGIIVRKAESLEDWKAYYEIYNDSLRRWGDRATSRYSWKFFEVLFDRHSSAMTLWLASYQGKVIAGALCFYSYKHVVYWHGSALEEHFNLRPVNLLMYECIKDACERKYDWFDFNPSGPHEGVRAFKKSFGAQPLAAPVINSRQIWVKVIQKAAEKIKRRS